MQYPAVRFLVLSSFAVFSLACGSPQVTFDPALNLPPVGTAGPDEVVVRSRAAVTIDTGGSSSLAKFSPSSLFDRFVLPSALAATGSQGVTVVSSPSVSMSLDNSGFILPSISNAVLSFGNLRVASIFDNNLKICGTNGNQKCRTALIRMYTTGTAAPGLYNVDDQFGAPISAGLSGSAATVGLNVAGAATMQSFSIANNKNVIRATDFTPTPRYEIQANFTEAGAGTYSTTLIIEYGLTL